MLAVITLLLIGCGLCFIVAKSKNKKKSVFIIIGIIAVVVIGVVINEKAIDYSV